MVSDGVPAVRIDVLLEPDQTPAQLVELTVARGSSPAAAAGPMVVQLRAGRRSIEVPAGFDGAELQRLVAAIESC